jgi:hypothetical protein
MNSAFLPLTFSLDQNSTLDTLEAVLAIARRGGLRLCKLDCRQQEVSLELAADDPDLLALFQCRLQNVIGVNDILVSEIFTS